MPDTFFLKFDEIQPSQIFISRKRLNRIRELFKTDQQGTLDPIPVKEIDGELVSTDGHSRGLAWYLNGYDEVEVEWEDLEMDWDLYRVFVRWCKEEGITSIPKLESRIISDDEFQRLWIERCQKAEADYYSKM